MRARGRVSVCGLYRGGGTAVRPPAPPRAPPLSPPPPSGRLPATRAPAPPPPALSRAGGLCGHPHPAARRRGPARAARSLRAAPGRAGFAGSGRAAATETLAWERFALAARGLSDAWVCPALDSAATAPARGGHPWLRREKSRPQPRAARAHGQGRAPDDVLLGEGGDEDPGTFPSFLSQRLWGLGPSSEGGGGGRDAQTGAGR